MVKVGRDVNMKIQMRAIFILDLTTVRFIWKSSLAISPSGHPKGPLVVLPQPLELPQKIQNLLKNFLNI